LSFNPTCTRPCRPLFEFDIEEPFRYTQKKSGLHGIKEALLTEPLLPAPTRALYLRLTEEETPSSSQEET
jgi:hypothetical protein